MLRPGGRLVFLTNSHLSALCVPDDEGSRASGCCGGTARPRRVQWDGGGVEFHPSHGDWVRLLRAAGFVVEALHEVFAPADGGDHPFYEIVSREWATRWPAEELWVATRAPEEGPALDGTDPERVRGPGASTVEAPRRTT